MAISGFFGDFLGIVKLNYKGVDLGRTNGGSTISKLPDVKDIISDQDGSKRFDGIRIGEEFKVKTTLIEIDNELLATIDPGLALSGNKKSVDLNRSLFQSIRDEAGVLIVTRCDEKGVISTNPDDRMYLYEVSAVLTGDLSKFDLNQRTLEVEFSVWWNGTKQSYGYVGYGSSLGL
jgi:hypothetical protein